VIRPARLEDADAIARIHIDAWRWAYRGLMPDQVLDELDLAKRADRWREILSKDETTTYVHAEPVVGFASVGASKEDPPGVAHLYALYQSPAVVGTGVARALLAECMRGVSEMTLYVLQGNERAIGFYAKHGFVADGQKDDPLGVHLRYRYIERPPSTSIVRPSK
jgi:ribosomal protein S18 acetylase RimI-like enzyme